MQMMAIELGVTLIAIAMAFAYPRIGARAFASMERTLAKLAHRRGLAAATVSLSVIVLRLALLPLFPIPLPFVPDDFSFLLAADTFAHGRLTNPTPAMWTHFESIHITMVPSYQSMYFPGQGLLLAAGQVLTGNPWFAVLVATALMCGAICWMLQAWVPPGWALAGGWIAVIRLGLFSDWINTYHTAGSMAALGGALVLGALPRLRRRPQFRFAMLLGIGIAIMALTRPYEGLLLCLPVGVALGLWILKSEFRPPLARLARYAVLPLALIAATCAWLGYYDLKAFGKATTLPYTADRSEYAIAPYFLWQQQRPSPVYRSVEMRNFYQKKEMDFFNKIHSPHRLLPWTMAKAAMAFMFYAGPLLMLPLIMVGRVFLDRRVQFLVVCALVLLAGTVIEVYLMPYYLAPFTAVFYGLGIQAMRHMRVWKPEGRPVGLAIVRLTFFLSVALASLRLFARPLRLAPAEYPPSNWYLSWYGPEHYGGERALIESKIRALPGGQLAIVRYTRDHDPLDEWVYNRADIDHSKVIWSREMDPADNLRLMEQYPNRKVWLVEPDATPARVTPYPMQQTPAADAALLPN